MDRAYPYLDLLKDFDEEEGLWWFSGNGVGGHTRVVVDLPRSHCGTISFIRLIIAAQTEKLRELDVMKILRAVKRTQIAEGRDAGEFLWYLEEDCIEDNHATFFNGLAMCAIYGGHRQQFTEEELNLIAEMLRSSYPIFIKHVKYFNRYYPNEYLGDLVCAWLIGEWFGMPDEDRNMLLDEFVKLERLWYKNGWGWGEHLSDTYGCVCLDELSMMLLLAQQLTDKAKRSLENLFSELLEIDDLFVGGPRVPAIRQYSFLAAPEGLHYRSLVKPVPENATIEHYTSAVGSRLPTCTVPLQTVTGEVMSANDMVEVWLPLGATFYKLNWHKVAPPAKKFDYGSYRIKCINGQAQIYIDKRIRIGGTERFPLMLQAEHLEWGLAWQSFPVAVWTLQREWIYMQWETSERDKRHHHPAEDKYKGGRLSPAITRFTNPPVVGKTYSVAYEDDFLILRVMPMIVKEWDKLIDRFRIVGASVGCVEINGTGNWHQLELELAQETLYLQCVELIEPINAHLECKSNTCRDWQLVYSNEELSNRRVVANLWGISRTKIDDSPTIYICEREMDIHSDDRFSAIVRWNWPKVQWNVKIDLADTESPFCWLDEEE